MKTIDYVLRGAHHLNLEVKMQGTNHFLHSYGEAIYYRLTGASLENGEIVLHFAPQEAVPAEWRGNIEYKMTILPHKDLEIVCKYSKPKMIGDTSVEYGYYCYIDCTEETEGNVYFRCRTYEKKLEEGDMKYILPSTTPGDLKEKGYQLVKTLQNSATDTCFSVLFTE